jgi:hypothetical protein
MTLFSIIVSEHCKVGEIVLLCSGKPIYKIINVGIDKTKKVSSFLDKAVLLISKEPQ